MDDSQRFGRTTVLDAQTSGLSWSAVVAGAVTAAWAFATILSATALGAVTSNIAGGATRVLGTGATADAEKRVTEVISEIKC
jgi:hypothetical protein